MLQPQAAHPLQSPARQQRLAARFPAAQNVRVSLSKCCAADHRHPLRLCLSGSGDVPLRAVVHQQARVAMRDPLVVWPGFKAGCRQLRDQSSGQRQR